MKKSLFSFGSAVLFAAVLTLSGCSWELPQTVGVKTNASYEFGFGEVKQDFGEKFDKGSLFKDMNTTDKKAYDYNPPSNIDQIQMFAMKVKVDVSNLNTLATALSSIPAGSYTSSTLPVGVTLPAIDSSTGGNSDMELPFSFKDIFSALDNVGSEFGSNLELCSLPVYVYLKAPDGITNVKLKDSKITFKCTDSSTPPVVLKDDSNADIIADINFTKDAVCPTFPGDNEIMTVEIDSLPSSGNLDIVTYAKNSSKKDNSKNYLAYHLEIDEFTTTGTVTGDFEIYTVIVLPLQFKTTGKISINMLEKAGKGDEDFFGRSEAGTPDNMKKIMDVADEISINYTIKELPMIANMNFDVDFDADGKKDSSGDSKSGKASINRYTLSNMLNTYPCKPSICLTVPSGEIIKMKRTMSMNLSITMGLKTNGTINVYEKGGK